jgi:hypothetical protein
MTLNPLYESRDDCDYAGRGETHVHNRLSAKMPDFVLSHFYRNGLTLMATYPPLDIVVYPAVRGKPSR